MKTSQTTDASAEIAETRRLSRASTFAALRHRNFQLYFGGQLISVAGTWLQIIAQGWLVYQLTRSELALGIVSFASAIPVLVVSPFGGVLVDRVPKRNLLVITQTASMLLALILALLTFTNVVQEWHVILLAAALGLVNAFDAPARQAFVVEMVGREDLTNAIALNSLMFNGGRIIGPAAGGLLLAALGPAWCFLINGISFLAVIAGLLAMRLPPHVSAPHTQVSSLKQLAGGFRYSKEVPEIM
ncbi:MAG TPA: MFS transporter, partial [Anaerolineales bacterium]